MHLPNVNTDFPLVKPTLQSFVDFDDFSPNLCIGLAELMKHIPKLDSLGV